MLVKEYEQRFGDYLKELRESYGYTLVELGEKIGYSDAYLSQIEKNRKRNPLTIHLLKDLSEALNEPYSNLLEMAGYEELAEGQRLLEMFGEIRSQEKNKSYGVVHEKELADKVGISKKLVESYLEVIHELELDGVQANNVMDYLVEILVSNREYIIAILEAYNKWQQLGDVSCNKNLDDSLLKEAYVEISSKMEKKKLLNRIEKGLVDT